jgi:hypothetical protein
MSSFILFKFKGSRAAPEKVFFDGITVGEQELKNLIAEKKGLDTTKDQYLLLNPEDGLKPFKPHHEFVKNSSVVVKREPLPPGLVARGRQQAAEAQDLSENQAYAAAQAFAAATAAITSEGGTEQAQVDQQTVRELEARAAVDLAASAWQAQTDQTILHARQREEQLKAAAAAGRGRGFGRGYGSRPPGAPPPICKHCGAVNAHFPDECPQRYAPRTDLRQVRAPTGIPASFLKDDDAGGLLLNTGKTAAVASDQLAAAKTFAALPMAKRAALAAAKAAQVPALMDRPHEAIDDGLLKTLLLDNEPADDKQQGQDVQQQQQQGPQQPQQQDAVAIDGEAALGGGSAAAGAAAGAAGLGLFDDEDLLPPAAAEGEGGGLNLGAGMELDQPPPQQQQQLKPAGSPLVVKQQQQQLPQQLLMPPKSPIGQAMQAAGGLRGCRVIGAVGLGSARCRLRAGLPHHCLHLLQPRQSSGLVSGGAALLGVLMVLNLLLCTDVTQVVWTSRTPWPSSWPTPATSCGPSQAGLLRT